MLLVLHLLEVSVWAAAFSAAHVLPDFETSHYYSLKSYTTVGYGDVLPPLSWRLLGPMEAAIGVLMLGWSTAIIVGAVQRIYGFRSASSTPGFKRRYIDVRVQRRAAGAEPSSERRTTMSNSSAKKNAEQRECPPMRPWCADRGKNEAFSWRTAQHRRSAGDTRRSCQCTATLRNDPEV